MQKSPPSSLTTHAVPSSSPPNFSGLPSHSPPSQSLPSTPLTQTPSPMSSSPAATTPPASVSSPSSAFSPIELMLIGGLAGSAAKTCIAPADNIKILFQVDPKAQFSIPRAAQLARTLVQEKGPLALWRGNSATLLRVFPYAAINYMSHDVYFHSLRNFWVQYPSYSLINASAFSQIQADGICRFIAGGLAGATSTVVTYPLDVFRARFAVSMRDPEVAHLSYAGLVRQVVNTLGVRGVYNGLMPTLLGIFPYNGISYATYHTLKGMYASHFPQSLSSSSSHGTTEQALPVAIHLACGAFAALIGQSLTYPLDVVRRRRQIGLYANMSVINVLKTILKNEGTHGFFRGLSLTWVKGPFAVGISFSVNDRLRLLASRHKQKHLPSSQ